MKHVDSVQVGNLEFSLYPHKGNDRPLFCAVEFCQNVSNFPADAASRSQTDNRDRRTVKRTDVLRVSLTAYWAVDELITSPMTARRQINSVLKE